MHLIYLTLTLLTNTILVLPTGASKRTSVELNPPPWPRDAVPEPEPAANYKWPQVHKSPASYDRNHDIWQRSSPVDEDFLNPPPWRRDAPIDFYNPPKSKRSNQLNKAKEKMTDERHVSSAFYPSDVPHDTTKVKGDGHVKSGPLELVNWDITDPNDPAKGITGSPLQLHSWEIVDHSGAFEESFQAGDAPGKTGKAGKGGRLVRRSF